MKMTITLSPEEVKEAITEYLKQNGFSNITNVYLHAGEQYDCFDRPYGVGFNNATADVEK